MVFKTSYLGTAWRRRVPLVVMAMILVATAVSAQDVPGTGIESQASSESDSEMTLRKLRVEARELAFAASVSERDSEAFASFIDPNAVFLGGAGELRGRAEIVEAWAGFFAPGSDLLRWRPERVAVDDEGQLAVSTGPYWIDRVVANGEVERIGGQFFSVWRQNPDGSWQVIFDAGTKPSAINLEE